MTDDHLRARNVALLIDADNASAGSLDPVLTVLAELGTVNIRRAYGNWQKPALSGWAKIIHRHAIEPQQQFDVAKGKSATDMKMTIDAMDLLYRGHVHGFGIMSSDSDFMPLAVRIKQDGLPVYGFGTAKTPEAFREACTRFIDVGALAMADEAEVQAQSPPERESRHRRGRGQVARRRDQGLEARRARLRQHLRDRPPRRQPLLVRRAQLRLFAPLRADRGDPQFPGREARRRRGLRQAGALRRCGDRDRPLARRRSRRMGGARPRLQGLLRRPRFPTRVMSGPGGG